MMNSTLNNGNNSIVEVSVEELGYVSGGFDREAKKSCLEPLVDWIID